MPAASRAGSTVLLLLVAVAGGGAAAVASAIFIWTYESLVELVWTDLPGELGVDPYRSWYLFAVPAVGGVLVGLGQRLLGNFPRPLGENVALWRSGGNIEMSTVPATTFNSLAALASGGPVGFEAALTGLIGGFASAIARQVGAAGSIVRQAWGAERVDERHRLVTTVPYWLAAIAGLFVYRWLPFGHLDLGFRFEDIDGHISVTEGLAAGAFALIITVPVAWAFSVVGRAELSTFFQRSPIVIAVVGGLVFASMAWVSQFVLFSGQQDMQRLVTLDNGELFYVAIAKWAALVIALFAGWRGGPIFPMFVATAAIAVIFDDLFDMNPNLIMVAGIGAVSVVLARGSIAVAFVLSLYAVPLTYSGVILVGCGAGAIALGIANALSVLPATEEHAPAPSETGAPVGIDAPAFRDLDR